jgi:methyl-accepting chemotaxis protein
MKFRSYAIPAIILAIILTMAAAAYLTSRLFANLTNSVEQSRFVMMQQIMATALEDAGSKALARAELVADMPEVKRLFAARDRDGLMATLKTGFETQKARHGIAQAQFHIAPAISFLRLNAPDKFGDDLTKFRPLVVAANRDHLPMKAVAIAKSGPSIFGITPVDDATGHPLGTFEFGLDFAPLLASLKNAYGLDFALFIDEKPLIEFASGVDPEKMGDQNRVGRFIRFESTNTELMSALVVAQDLMALSEPSTLVRDFNGLARGVMLLPINNASGTMIGVMAAAADFSGTRAASSQAAIWQGVITFIAILVLSGFVIVVLRGYLLRPLELLADRFAAFAKGDRVVAIAESERFPIELQPMVAVLDELANRQSETGLSA